MLAHYHGQTWNAAEPARALGVSQSTARRYLDLLTDAFVIRQSSMVFRFSRVAGRECFFCPEEM
jgi:predicted AAA+ superfamily ATPase